MNWNDLCVFLAVARSESLSGAGRRLRIDPATVGRRISRLEKAAGAPLFVRSQRGYVLTAAGERLLPHAEAAEAAVLAGADAATGPDEGLSGLVRLGAPDGCANFLLPQVIARICDANPHLDVQIVALPQIFNLSKREADMAIGVSRPETGRLMVQKLSDYHLVLAASRAWVAAHPPIRTVADLQPYRFVGYIPDLIFDEELDYMGEFGVKRVPLTSNSAVVQLNFLRCGAGIGVVHDFALPAEPSLVRILPGVRLSRAFWLIRHATDVRVARLARFARVLVRETRAEMAALERRT